MDMFKTILVVDDNKINRKILVKILSSEYSVLEAENGAVALEILRQNHESISVVLLDIVMPVLDGYDVLRRMHEDAFLSKIPVIVASGQNTEDAEVKALSLGANDYVLKPYKPEIIKHRIANTIYLMETSSFVNSVQRDALTGIYGKDYFYLQVNKILNSHPENQYDLICYDIERFKLVNDRYGTHFGDDLLKYIANIMVEALDGYGICGRLGSDDFACLVPHREQYQKEDFSSYINLINKFSKKVSLDLVLKYGIYFIEDSTTPVNIMCDRAILAKESIKGKYETFFAYYNDTIRQKLLDEQMIISNAKKALQENQFQVYFQPKYDLKTNEIVGAEALVRWLHPVKGFLPPSAFIPIFERNGFISELDYYIWEQCCQKMKAWADLGNTVTPVSINVSRVDIYDQELPEKLVFLIQKYELSPKYLHLEITESAYTENSEQLIEMVSKIKSMGFIIEMDDFGTGYSSLNMLSELPIDILKLDMRFIQKEEKKNRDRSILSFIISLAKWMDLQVVAEGIEKAEQVQLLQALNCEYAQGYFFAKPMPQEQFEQCLLESKIKGSSQLHKEIHAGKKTENKQLKTLLLMDRNGRDYPMLEKEYNASYHVVYVETPKQALVLIRKEKEAICALTISLPDSIPIEEATVLMAACKKHNIPLLVIYDQDDPSAEDILNLNLSDYTSRPYEFRQFNLRLENAMASARMKPIVQEKEINAAIIEMRKRAEHDSLTGLLNRAEFEVRIDHYFHQNHDPQGIFIVLDVDNFKKVNDTFGHVLGDQVLNTIGTRINALFPETTLVARIGGDEFSVFVPYHLPQKLLQDKMDSLCSSGHLNVENMAVTCSGGICYCPEDGYNHKDLYKKADMALIYAKRHGKSKFEVFAPHMNIIPPSSFKEKTIQMLDQVSDAMFVSDAVTSEVIYINEPACNAIGKSKIECFGKRCYEIFWDRGRHCNRCEFITTDDFYEENTLLKDNETLV
ncbi:MAG: EAL domain-containing protein, partial [Eubacterium sp.]